MALQNFIDRAAPVVSAAWLNAVDILKFTIFGDSTTKAQARTALTSDAPLEIANGGTGSRLGPGPAMNPRSAAEINIGLTPGNFTFSEEYIQVKRFAPVGTSFNGSQANAEAHTAAAEAAMLLANEYTGAKVVFEHGGFVVNRPLVPDGDGLEVICDGADLIVGDGIPTNGAIVHSLAGGADAATNQAILDSIYGAGVVLVRQNITGSLENVKFRGLRCVAGANAGRAIHMTGFTRGCSIENGFFDGFEVAAVALNGSWSFSLEKLRCRGPGALGVGLELGVTGGGTRSGSVVCNAVNVHGCHVTAHATGGRWNFGAGGSWRGNTFEQNSTGWTSQSCTGFDFLGNYLELNTTRNMSLGGTNGVDFIVGAVIAFNHLNNANPGGDNIRLQGLQLCKVGPFTVSGTRTQWYTIPAASGANIYNNEIWIPALSSTYAGNASELDQDTNFFFLTDAASDRRLNVPKVRSSVSFTTAATSTLGLFGATAVSQQADPGNLTDSVGGTVNGTLQALTDPTDTPASADALRDDLVANLIPQLRNNLSELAAKYNDLRTKFRNYGVFP